MKKRAYNFKVFLYILIIYLLVFQNFLQTYIPIFQYADELIAILGFFVACNKLIKNKFKIKKENLIIIACLLIITVAGFTSIFLYNYQSLEYALIDCFLVIKFFLAYFLGRALFEVADLRKKSNTILINIKIISIILAIFTAANYVFDLYPGEIRFGIKSNQLFFSHPTYLVAIAIFLLANYIVFSKKILSFCNILLLFIIVSTLRVKAICIAAVSVLIMIYILKTNRKIVFRKLLIFAIICLLIALPQVRLYFVELDENARKALLETSIEIANDYFPIGTGFGTFGSFESGENYSPIYELYGINNVWGLQRGKAYYVADSFWPMILGQFGYIGCIAYIICIIMIFLKIQREYSKKDKYTYAAKMICLAYLIISSTSESAFANSIAIPLALILGL